jgi:hypothetical protein
MSGLGQNDLLHPLPVKQLLGTQRRDDILVGPREHFHQLFDVEAHVIIDEQHVRGGRLPKERRRQHVPGSVDVGDLCYFHIKADA